MTINMSTQPMTKPHTGPTSMPKPYANVKMTMKFNTHAIKNIIMNSQKVCIISVFDCLLID